MPPAELKPGMRVCVRGLAKAVILRRIDERNAEVEAGPLRMKVALGDILGVDVGAPLVHTERSERAAPLPPGSPRSSGGAASSAPTAGRGANVYSQSADEEAPEEVNVIGCTVEEATDRLDKLLDSAVLAGKSRLRVIHGHGTGALRRGLAAFFTGHPHVARFFAEKPEHGGDAITIVELKG